MRTSRPVLLIALAAVAVVAVIVLLVSRGSGSSELVGPQWQLTAITEKAPAYQGVVPASEQAKFTITFNDDDTFESQADCNVAAGTYRTTSSGGLTIEVGPSTMVACPDGSYSDLFLHALGQAASYAIADDELTITLGDGGTLTFRPAGEASASATPEPTPSATPSPTPSPTASPTASPTEEPTAEPTPSPSPSPTAGPTSEPTTGPTSEPTAAPTAKPTPAPTAAPTPAPTPPPGADLIGRTWQLTTITLRDPIFQGVIPVADQGSYTVTFSANGTFSAQADCNTVAGTYAATSSGGLTITPGPSTIVACADDSYGDLYVLGLSSAASYVVASDQLTITTRDGGSLAYR